MCEESAAFKTVGSFYRDIYTHALTAVMHIILVVPTPPFSEYMLLGQRVLFKRLLQHNCVVLTQHNILGTFAWRVSL